MHKRTRANKRRLEKRRRTRRKQRGGASQTLQDWLNAIKELGPFKKDSDRYKSNISRVDPAMRLGEYRLAELKQENLTLPDSNQDQESYVIDTRDAEDPLDIRTEGATLLKRWGPILNPQEEGDSASITPAEFQAYIQHQLKPDPNNDDIDIELAVKHLIMIENKLRSIAGKDSITDLADEKMYPLFVWAVIMNTRSTTPLVPSLVPQQQVDEELLHIPKQTAIIQQPVEPAPQAE